MKTYSYPAALLFVLVLSAPPMGAQFKWSRDKTIQVHIPRGPAFGLTVKRVAFGQPNGQCGSELVDRMIMPDFRENSVDVIERQQLDQILAEHNFNQSAYADAASSAKLGKILGPSALILVNVYGCNPEQKSLYQDQPNYVTGGIHRTFISRTRFNLEGSIKIVDLTTGQVLGSHNFQSKPERQNAADNGQPEFPDVDVLKDDAMQAVKSQIHAMFFPSSDVKDVVFYDDKDCGLKEVYELLQRGDKDGALRLSFENLNRCKTGAKKDKSLARAYYDAGLLSCLHRDYEKSKELFGNAMQSKGAEAVAETSSDCSAIQSGDVQVKSYLDRFAKIPEPSPIGAGNKQTESAAANPPAAQASSQVASPPSATAVGKPSVEERLKKLDELLKKGLITRKEYDAKKAEILKEL